MWFALILNALAGHSASGWVLQPFALSRVYFTVVIACIIIPSRRRGFASLSFGGLTTSRCEAVYSLAGIRRGMISR